MAEAVGEAVVVGLFDNGDFRAYFVQHLRPVFQTAFFGFAVNPHVEEAEFHLPRQKQADLEVLRRQHFVEQFARQRPAAFFVCRHVGQRLVFPGEVFHKLARQFYRVPFHAVDAGHAQFVHAGQQVVQAVPGFMEEGNDFVVTEVGGLAVDRRGEVADEVGGRQLQGAVGQAAAAFVVVHPCAAAFAFSGV